MIIHELRSPANQLKYKVEDALKELDEIKNKQYNFFTNSKNIAGFNDKDSPRFGQKGRLNSIMEEDKEPESVNLNVEEEKK